MLCPTAGTSKPVNTPAFKKIYRVVENSGEIDIPGITIIFP